ncbi:MAG: DUF3108 domain-containing protein [Ignavibacteria bacterium]|nr:DUF3108 domain-containing protein [Ignavibacteria bacterium]
MKLFLLIAVICQIIYSDSTRVIKNFRTHTNNAFTFGERLSFEVNYGFITAAEAFMTVSSSPFIYNGRETYEINFEVNSRPGFDPIYKVRDNYKTFIDVQGFFPWRFEQHIREKNFTRDFEATFIQESLKVYTKVNYVEDKVYHSPYEYVQDLISAFYYARTLDWRNKKAGDVVTVNYFYKDSFYPLEIRFEGREDVSVEAGDFRTFILRPMLREGFTSKTSDIYVYLTDDERKIPVKVKMKIVIGSLVAELTDYSGLNGPLDAKK